MVQTLDIFLNDTYVGVITRLADSRTLFTFDEEYISDANRVVLSQSFYSAEKALLTKTRAYSNKLPPFFSNLLPEGALREYLAKVGGVKVSDEFGLLSLLGEDLPGSVVARVSERFSSGVEFENEALLRASRGEAPLCRFSLAGVQLKFSATMESCGRLTIPGGGGGGDWIIKLPSSVYDYVPENEYAIMDVAKEVGISVPDIKVVSLGGIEGMPDVGQLRGDSALAVKRFDRGVKGRVHIEDFAQVYSVFPDGKYEGVSFDNISGMVWTLMGEEGLVDFIRRLVFTIVTGNGDMHLKNWSLIYADGRTPKMSPAYDLLSTVPYIPGDGLALGLLKTKSMMSYSCLMFEKLCEKVGLPKKLVLETVQHTVEQTLEVWERRRPHYDLPVSIGEAIDQHMKQTLLVRELT